MKARLIKQGEVQNPAPQPKPKLAKKTARPGGPAIDPRAAFNALFAKK